MLAAQPSHALTLLTLGNRHPSGFPTLAPAQFVPASIAALSAAAHEPVLNIQVTPPVDLPASVTLEALRGLESASDAATLVYYAGHLIAGADRELYLTTTDSTPETLAASAIPLEHLRDAIERSPRLVIVLAIDCVAHVDLQSARKTLARLFARTRPEIYVLIAPTIETSGTGATPLASSLARGIREDAFASDRAPEAISVLVDAHWRVKGLATPLWRWPVGERPSEASPKMRTLRLDSPRVMRSTSSPSARALAASPEPESDRPLIELGGTGTVWYATNRQPLDPSDGSRGYSAVSDGTVHYGRCTVHVPQSHKIGSTRLSLWERLWSAVIRPTATELTLTNIEELAAPAYWDAMRGVVTDLSSGARDVLVFLHGYNVSFADAARRAAQIACDLKFPGVTAFYSWPSQADLAGYFPDGRTIEVSESHIAEFLLGCAGKSGAHRVHVIAHSMGNRALIRVLADLAREARRDDSGRFGHFILAAPDVDREFFIQRAAGYHQLAETTTLYVSNKDLALKASGVIFDSTRAGFFPPLTIVSNIDTVNVGDVDLTKLGHGYVAEARDVLNDMQQLLINDIPARRRSFTQQATAADGSRYWVIRGRD